MRRARKTLTLFSSEEATKRHFLLKADHNNATSIKNFR